jgi:putative phosphoesterase
LLVGVISDTHDNLDAVKRAARIFLERRISLVLHLGDIVAPFTLRAFHEAGIEKLIAAYGNNCGERIGLRETAAGLGYEIHEWPHLVEIGGKKLLMIHGTGPSEKTKSMIEAFARSGLYDAVLYGHTHEVDNRVIGKTLVLNPGEACGCLTGKKTVAILDTESMKAEIISL